MPRPSARCCLAVIGIIGLLAPAVAHADQKSDDVTTLMSLDGQSVASAESRMSAAVGPILQRFAAAHPDVPPDALAALQGQVTAQERALFETIVAEVRSHYEADLSDAEIRAIIAFYASPPGQTYLRESAVIRNVVAAEIALAFPVLIAELRDDFIAALKRRTPPPEPG